MEDNRSIMNKTAVGAVLFCAVLLYLLFAVSLWASSLKEVVRCTDFKTQSEAEAKYLTNTAKYKNLDRDHDGIACSNLPKI